MWGTIEYLSVRVAPCRNGIDVLHHLGVFASDFEASRAFYVAALAPLDIEVGFETADIVEFCHSKHDTPSLSLERGLGEVTRGLHVAFEASQRSEVDAFHAAAVAAGGREHHAPRYWPEYRAYCAFVGDPDGNNVEALVKDDE